MSNRPGYGGEKMDQEPTKFEEIDFVQPHKKMPVTLDLTSCDNAVSRQTVKEQMIKYGFHAPDMTITEFVEDLPPVTPQPKTGHWREVDTNQYACSHCNHCFSIVSEDNAIEEYKYCPNCQARMVEPQKSEG